MEAAEAPHGLDKSHDEIASLAQLMADLAERAGGGAKISTVAAEEESLDFLVSKYLCVEASLPGAQQPEDNQQQEQLEQTKWGPATAGPGHYWVGCTTPYFAEEAVAGLGDPLGAVVAGSHVRVVAVHDHRWVVEVPPPHGASYARLRVSCLASDIRASAWRRLS